MNICRPIASANRAATTSARSRSAAGGSFAFMNWRASIRPTLSSRLVPVSHANASTRAQSRSDRVRTSAAMSAIHCNRDHECLPPCAQSSTSRSAGNGCATGRPPIDSTSHCRSLVRRSAARHHGIGAQCSSTTRLSARSNGCTRRSAKTTSARRPQPRSLDAAVSKWLGLTRRSRSENIRKPR